VASLNFIQIRIEELFQTPNRNSEQKRKGKQKKKIKEEARSPTGPTPGDQPAQPAPS
jgi:hypothetical protein